MNSPDVPLSLFKVRESEETEEVEDYDEETGCNKGNPTSSSVFCVWTVERHYSELGVFRVRRSGTVCHSLSGGGYEDKGRR